MADLEIKIGASLNEINSSLKSLKAEISKVGNTSVADPFKTVEKGASTALNQVKELAKGIVTAFAVMKVIHTADEFTTLSARIRIATNSTEEFNRAQEGLFSISQQTRTSLETTSELYSKLAIAVKDAGVGEETLLRVTRTINESIQLSGVSAQTAAASIYELTQGLATGVLQGRDLRSVFQDTPVLAKAIADGLNVPISKLKELGQQGQLTSQQVIQALLNVSEKTDATFAKMPVTVGQAFTQVENAFMKLVGVFNSTSGTTGAISSALTGLADYLSSKELLGSVAYFADEWSSAFRLILQNTSDTTSKLTHVFGLFFDYLFQSLKDLPINFTTALEVMSNDLAHYFETVKALNSDQSNLEKSNALQKISNDRNAQFNAILSQRQDILKHAEETRKRIENDIEVGNRNSGRNSLGQFDAELTNEQMIKLRQKQQAELEAQEVLLKYSSARQINIIKNMYSDAAISTEVYYEKRRQVELKAIDDEIAIQRKREALDDNTKAKALANIEILEKQRADIIDKEHRNELESEKDLQKQITQVQIQQLENQGKIAEATKLKLQQQYGDLIKRLKADGKANSAALVENLIDTSVSKARVDEIKNQIDKLITSFRSQQKSLADQVQIGAISQPDAQDQLNKAAIEARKLIADKQQELLSLAQEVNNPEAIQSAEQAIVSAQEAIQETASGAEKALIDLRAAWISLQRDFAGNVANAGVDALTNLFTDVASGAKSANQAIRDFALSFAQSMLQIAARALATLAVLELLNAVMPGLGNAVAAGSGAGGLLGSAGTAVKVGAVALNAPKYHNGGIVGLKPDEQVAILQTGERVLSREDVKNSKSKPDDNPGYRIVNVVDPNMAGDYVNSAAGEKAILNIIGRNGRQVRQILGA